MSSVYFSLLPAVIPVVIEQARNNVRLLGFPSPGSALLSTAVTGSIDWGFLGRLGPGSPFSLAASSPV